MQTSKIVHVMALMSGAAILWSLGAHTAAACNRINGCTMDVLQESHDMMQDGRMSEGMRQGRENIEAFRRQQAADQAAGQLPVRR